MRLARLFYHDGGARAGGALGMISHVSAAGSALPARWFPRCTGSASILFTFHMIEHELLMAVSAPLLVVARPIGTLLWALRGRREGRPADGCGTRFPA